MYTCYVLRRVLPGEVYDERAEDPQVKAVEGFIGEPAILNSLATHLTFSLNS